MSHNETNYRADEVLAEQVGDSRAQIRRYIRLTELIPELLEYVDLKRIPFTSAVEISYLDKEIQKWLFEYIRDNGLVKPRNITLKRVFNGRFRQVIALVLLNRWMLMLRQC